MAPFDLDSSLGFWGAGLANAALGFGFGFVLEQAGFGSSRKLVSQFYLDDQAVLKVMFTGIVTAMVLTFWASALGLVDFDRVWVPPTYLWPGIVGGILIGVGFIIGGYCPGTSLVAMATLKFDGLAFLLGCLGGTLAFAEAVAHLPALRDFWGHTDAIGRLTLFEWLGVDGGLVVLAVALMALGMFAGAGWLERRFGPRPAAAPVEVQP